MTFPSAKLSGNLSSRYETNAFAAATSAAAALNPDNLWAMLVVIDWYSRNSTGRVSVNKQLIALLISQ